MKPNIYEPVAMLCERLGLEPNMVRELVVTPTTVRAEVYRKNDYGFKHIIRDGGPDEGRVALDVKEFEVTTVD